MSHYDCAICGTEIDTYGDDPFAGKQADGIAIRIYNYKTKRFDVKHYWTCRDCSNKVLRYIEQEVDELKGE